jgi:outer membrane receptor protein involved in Fe transport
VTAAAWLAAGLLTLQAGAPQTFDLRSGAAVPTINRLAAQAGIDVVITADLAGRRTPALRGRMTPEAALDRLLRPLGARAVRIGDGVYRIEAAPPPPRRPTAPPPALPPVVAEPTTLTEVIVTAVPPVGLRDASGRSLITPGALERIEGAPASEAVADLSATVDSTRQGTGRNKLFVRGLSDSAMNGPLQATVGQYLGDLRLGYGAPDPDVALIDIRRIEVFEGPQGTRFGAGSIGGVLRIQPEAPVLAADTARFIIGGGMTSGGEDSREAAVVVNRAFGDRAAARLVAYGRHDGGFLDNPGQALGPMDGIDTVGGRLALRWTDDAWSIDLTGMMQKVSADDAQTVPAGETGFSRSGRVLEPYESSIAIVGLTARRRIGRATLTSATSLSQQRLTERFDATQPGDPFPSAVDRRQSLFAVSSETRIEMNAGDGWSWSGGATVGLGEVLVERRRLGLVITPALQQGVDLTRSFAEVAAFGEAALSPAPNWRVAIGARLSAVNIDSNLEDVAVGLRVADDRRGVSWRLTPSLSARWDATPALTLFGRFEQAVRPAGVNEAGGAFARYQGDRVTLLEFGARTRELWGGVSAEMSAGWMDWRDVQADVVTEGGDLVTDNVGDGVIHFISVKAGWQPLENLDVSAGVFLNESSLTRTRYSTIGGGTTDIPNVAPVGAQMSLDWAPGEIAGLPLSLGADFRYVGQSRLGVGPMLDVPQGGYLRAELTARLGDERRAAVLRISNPFDTRGIRYGIGSPYQLSEPQAAPVRPLTVRLTFEAAF